MSISCGIVGLPNVGKSTIFNALTAAQAEQGNYPFCTIDPNVAVVEVPDPNLEILRAHVVTEKVIPAVVRVVDIAGLIEGASKGEGMGNQFLANIRECEAIMHVVRCFGGTRVVREEAVNPTRDMELIELELALADLETVTKALDRAVKQSRTGDKDALARKAALSRAREALEQGRMLSALAWRDEELAALRPLCLMTLKKMLYVANVADDDLEGTSTLAGQVAARAEATGAGWVPICGDLESELRSMSGADRQVFMQELGLERLGLEKLIRAVYAVLGLQTYYTAGPKEIRAWTIKAGDTAPRAAGVIHTDFQKGFIRAQIYSVQDMVECGTEAAVKAAGRLRTEGRDYVVREADVCHFLIGK